MKIAILIAFEFLLIFFSYKTRARKKISSLLIMFASVLLTFLLAEFCYRVFLKKEKLINLAPSCIALHTKDSLLGYKLKGAENFEATEILSGGDTVFHTNYTILNDTSVRNYVYPFRKGYKSSKNGKEVIFMGCSITFGVGLPDTATLPWYYGKTNDVSTINLGCTGYGIHQVFQLFNLKFDKQDNRNRVFIYPFIYDHILRANGIYAWNNAGPYFEISGNTLIDKGPLYKYRKVKGEKLAWYASGSGAFSVIKDNIEKIAYQYSVKNLTEKDYERCFIMLDELSKKIAASGGKLVILHWGNYHQSNSPISNESKRNIDKKLFELTRYGATVIPVSSIINLSDQRYFIPLDNHPSALANQVIAAYLSKKNLFSF